MRVLITGGAGFIGSNFIRFALSQHSDWELWNLDKLTYAANPNSLRDVANNPRYHFVRGDIADPDVVRRIMANGIQLVINFAAESHVDRSIAQSADFLRTSVIGVQVLLEAAREYGLELFYQISTDEVYGDLPAGEYAKETDRLHPSSPYSAAKASSDLLVLAYARTYGLPVLISRCTNNYGPYQHVEKMLPLFVTNLMVNQPVPVYGDGRQVRDWLHVDDHCRAIDVLMTRGQRGEIYNVGANHYPEWTNLQVTTLVLRALGAEQTMIRHVADRPGHDRRYAVDTKKIQTLGWQPKVPPEAGIRQVVEWYRTHREWWGPVRRSPEFINYYRRQYAA